jgi:hypothetical protein
MGDEHLEAVGPVYTQSTFTADHPPQICSSNMEDIVFYQTIKATHDRGSRSQRSTRRLDLQAEPANGILIY